VKTDNSVLCRPLESLPIFDSIDGREKNKSCNSLSEHHGGRHSIICFEQSERDVRTFGDVFIRAAAFQIQLLDIKMRSDSLFIDSDR